MQYVDFCEKGTDPRCGGTIRVDSPDERLALTAELKAADLKVTWSDHKGNREGAALERWG